MGASFGNVGAFNNVETDPAGNYAGVNSGSFVGANAGTPQAGQIVNLGSGQTGTEQLGGYLQDSQANPSANPLFYENAANTATGQAANYYNQGLAAGTVAAPTVYNPTAAASRTQLAGVNAGYRGLQQNLANTIQGGGINAGAATEMQGLNQGIASQLGAAHGGHGGYQLGNAIGAQNIAATNGLGLASQAAQARGQQINAAQTGLGSALTGQGGLALSQYGTEQGAAQAQAALREQQNQENQAQQLALYNQSLGEQGTYLNAANQYINQAQAEQGLTVKQQAINNAQNNQTLGAITQAGSAALGLAAMV